MRERPNRIPGGELPTCAVDFIRQVTRKIRYRRRVRQDVEAELTAHFEDELRVCTSDDEREQRARRLVEEFGDAGLLGVLCRRAKKRCRPVWAQTLVRAGQGAGVCLLLFAAYLIWFFSGEPNARIQSPF